MIWNWLEMQFAVATSEAVKNSWDSLRSYEYPTTGRFEKPEE